MSIRSSSERRIIRKLESSSSGGTARSSDSQMCTRDQSMSRSASSSWQRSGVDPPASAMWKTSRSAARRAITSAARAATASASATVVSRTSDPGDQPGVVALGRQRRLLGGELLVGADDVHDGVDQRQVGERLREVAEVPPGAGVDLLGVEVQRRRVAEQLLAQVTREPVLADLAQRAD